MFKSPLRSTALIIAIFVAVDSFPLSLGAADSDLTKEILQRIAQLDADAFGTRQQAHERLVRIGEAAVPFVLKATISKSLERRYRAREILRQIRRKQLGDGFAKISRQKDEDIELDDGMWLISRIVNPAAKRADQDRKLNEMAAAVRRRLGKDADPRKLAPKMVVDAVIHVLKNELRLQGNTTNYDHPDNSSLERVLSTRKGLPILLAHVAVSVGERLDVPIVGLAVPSRYMIKYDGARAPEGQPRDDIVIDPYGGWEILTNQQIKEIIPSFDPAQHLQPSSRRATLVRMMSNLESDFAVVQDVEKAREVREFKDLLSSEIDATR